MKSNVQSLKGDCDIVSSPSDSDDSNDEDYSDVPVSRKVKPRPFVERRVKEDHSSSHITSRLFEIVIMHRHAKLSTCLQRIWLTISSAQRYTGIADILSFICECAGFKHSSISPESLLSKNGTEPSISSSRLPLPEEGNAESRSPLDLYSDPDTNQVPGESSRTDTTNILDMLTDFNWDTFRLMLADLPRNATFAELQHCCLDKDVPYYDLNTLVGLPNSTSSNGIPNKFQSLCLSRVRHLAMSLEVHGGWTIGFGRNNAAYVRFKEFFYQLVLDSDESVIGDLIYLCQWILALSLIGFRVIRQYAHIAAMELVNGLLVKLNTLCTNERVLKRQLQVEIEMDQRSHERKYGSCNPSVVPSKSSLEIYKKLVLAQRAQILVSSFIQAIYGVHITSKQWDVLVDIRIASAFGLCSHLLLCPRIFAREPYISFVYSQLPRCDPDTRLMLLQYLLLAGHNISEEQLGILIGVHNISMRDGCYQVCEYIELLLLGDIHCGHGQSVVSGHKHDSQLQALLNTLSRGPCAPLAVLVASLYIPALPIHNFCIPLRVSAGSLRSRYRNILFTKVQGTEKAIKINDPESKDPGIFSKCMAQLISYTKSIPNRNAFGSNLVVSLWNHNTVFSRVSNVLDYICAAGDVSVNSVTLDEGIQEMLLNIARSSLEHVLSLDNGPEDVRMDAVGSVINHGEALLKLFKASVQHVTIVLQMIESASGMAQSCGIPVPGIFIGAIKDMILHIVFKVQDDTAVDAIRYGVRSLYNLGFIAETKAHVSSLYDLLSERSCRLSESCVTTLHCILILLHYLPLELESALSLISVVRCQLECPLGSDRLLWCGIGYVLFEAALYKSLRSGNKTLDDAYIALRNSLLTALASLVGPSSTDYINVVAFTSMATLIQVSALVVNTGPLPGGIATAMYDVIHAFLVKLNKSSSRGPLNSLPKKGITVSDVFVNGMTDKQYTISPVDALYCLGGLFTKVLSRDLYCSGVSILLSLQLVSSHELLSDMGTTFIRFVSQFDRCISIYILLATMIGLYESDSRYMIPRFSTNFTQALDGMVDPQKLDVDLFCYMAVRYSLHSPGNWDFLLESSKVAKELKGRQKSVTTVFKKSMVDIISKVELEPDLRDRLKHFFSAVDLPDKIISTRSVMSDAEHITSTIDNSLGIVRSLQGNIDFNAVGGLVHVKRATGPSVKRKHVESVTPKYHDSSVTYPDNSPVVVRTFTNSLVNVTLASIGMKRNDRLSVSEVPLSSVDLDIDLNSTGSGSGMISIGSLSPTVSSATPVISSGRPSISI
ncbi:STAG domain family protein [Babesia bovis T2Bo]|uniref:SCD domain-containing protein n=1 Tax=Babesia bovis TaxID=5865 RepID=A7ATR1_BABBO|nr:STAG domain family protein [Babesia bovis T2Bo]EDO06322.1 STAG domain family protein [Babesia bovis T2Bo]|eukprot:XP_001609890.1 hypothetical protein [Babesia bovis T2Bo]